jgi:acyl-CoA thioester hydrolase
MHHLRTHDLDWMGHVNNAAFAEYLQEARVDLNYDFRGGLSMPDLATVVAALEITYKQPLHFAPEPVAIDTWVERVGRTSYTLGHEVRSAEPDTDILYATARTVMVQVDRSTEKPRNIGDPFRLYLEQYVDPDVPA